MSKVSVVYGASADEQWEGVVEMSPGMSVLAAIEASGVLLRYPGLDLSAVGVFGKRRKLEDGVKAGDRVEIYRGLVVDPKEARRVRARQSKA